MTPTSHPRSPAPAAFLALGAVAVAVVSLAALHVTDPQLAPSWRMVSEYADGRAPWLLSTFFVAWGVASWATAWCLWPLATTWRPRLGVALVALSGIGEAGAAVFNVHHPLHGAAFGIGVPSLAIGALLIGGSVAAPHARRRLRLMAQLPWLSVALMALSFVALARSAAAVGIELTPGKPWGAVPPGVFAVMGWTNRLLVLAYLAWLVAAIRSTSTNEGAGTTQ